jgi:hypothetical protein
MLLLNIIAYHLRPLGLPSFGGHPFKVVAELAIRHVNIKLSHGELSMQVITKELRDAMAKALDQTTVSEKTARAILLLCKSDITAQEALKLASGLDNPSPHTCTDLRRKSQRWLLASPEMQELAGKAVKDTLKMKPVAVKVEPGSDEKKYIYPTVSNRLAAADMVTSRTEPVKSNEGSGGNTYNFVQINADKYRAQDVVQHDTGEDGPETISI